MSHQEQEFTLAQQKQLDRLVDGELGDCERRELLAALEGRPDGWRRCALAFLEAQSWTRELRAFESASASVAAFSSTSTAAGNPLMIVPAPRSVERAPYMGLLFAMAASFLVAFGLAWVIRGSGLRREASDLVPAGSFMAQVAAVDAPADAKTQPDADVATDRDRLDSVTLVMDDGASGRREVELPVVEDDEPSDAWLSNADPTVPRELCQVLERLGHHVDESRQYLPVNLEDGRQLIVPVDEVKFTPVSARTYQ